MYIMEPKNPTLTDDEAVSIPDSMSENAFIIDMEASDEGFIEQLLNVNYTKEQYNFTQEQVDRIVLRLLEVVERQAEDVTKDDVSGDDKFLSDHTLRNIFSIGYSRLFMPYRREFDRENVQDQVLISVTNLALSGEHMKSCAAFLSSIVLQKSEKIRPEVLFKVGEELTWHQNVDIDKNGLKIIDYINQELMSAINYDINYGSGYFQEQLLEKFEISNSPVEQLKILEFAKKCFFSLSAESYNVKKEPLELLQGLAGKVYNESDNYLVKNRAEIAVGEMSRADADYGISPYQEEFRYWQDRQNVEFISSTRNQEQELMKLYLGDDYREEKHNQQRKMLLLNGNFRFQLYEIQSRNEYANMLCIDLSPKNIGIYDTSGNLKKIHSNETSRDISITELPILGEKEGDNYDQLKEFSILLSLPMRHVVEKDFGIDLAELDYSIQYYLLNFLKTRTYDEAKELAKFTQKFGIDGFKTFLSLDAGTDMSDKIFAIDKNLPEDVSRKVFAKYGEIVDAAETLRDHIASAYGDKEGYSPEQSENIIQNILFRGKELLTKFSAKSNPDQAIDELEQERVAVIAFGEMFSELKSSCELKDFAGINIESKRAQDIGEDERKQMASVLKGNWDHEEYPTIYPMLENGLNASLEEESLWTYHFVKYNLPNDKKEQDIAMFMRFRPLEHEGYEYMAGVNVHPVGRGKRIGEAGMRTIIDLEAAKAKLIASVYAKHNIASHYVKNGFVVSGVYRDFHETGEPYLCIVRDDEAKGYFWPEKSKEEIIAMADQAQDRDHFVVKAQNSDRYQVHNAEIDAETKNSDLKYCETLEPYFHQGFVCTALYKDGKDWYFAMEKNRSAEDVYVDGDGYKIERRNQMEEAA